MNYATDFKPIRGQVSAEEWQAQDGSKRQSVEVVADTIQFLLENAVFLFIGLSRDVVTGVWVGNSDFSPIQDVFAADLKAILVVVLLTSLPLATNAARDATYDDTKAHLPQSEQPQSSGA